MEKTTVAAAVHGRARDDNSERTPFKKSFGRNIRDGTPYAMKNLEKLENETASILPVGGGKSKGGFFNLDFSIFICRVLLPGFHPGRYFFPDIRGKPRLVVPPIHGNQSAIPQEQQQNRQ